jgi:hypothetical protein
MLVFVPFLSGTTVDGVSRIYNKVYHNFNNQRCKIKLLNAFVFFSTNQAITFRLDCPELRPAGLPVSQFGVAGNGIALIPYTTANYASVSGSYEWETTIMGDSMTFDLCDVTQPTMSGTPYGTAVFSTGYVTLDITPI